MKHTLIALVLILILAPTKTNAQELKPGFDKTKYIDLLKINQKAHIALDKWIDDVAVPAPEQFNFIYRSPVVAFDNIWDLWIHKYKSIAVTAIQGSVQTEASFLANLYAAMIPAKGELQLDQSFKFKYNLSNNPQAGSSCGVVRSDGIPNRNH